MKAKEVLRILRVDRTTLSTYVKTGKIRVVKLHNGRYDYNEEDVYKLAGKKLKVNKRKVVLYCRVSTYNQKKDLENQEKYLREYCASKGITVHEVYKDTGSGLDIEKRVKFKKLLDQVLRYEISEIYITYKDRFSRIGYNLLKEIFATFGTKIVPIFEDKDDDEKIFEKEIFKELISIIHAFSMRVYSKRKKQRLTTVKKELELENSYEN